MKNIQAYLANIHEKTGIAMALFDASGVKQYATPDFSHAVNFSIVVGKDIYTDETQNLTFIKVRSEENMYVVVLGGTNETVLNYAALISSAIELTTVSDGKLEHRIKMLLLGELTDAQESMLKVQLTEQEFNHYMLSLTTQSKLMQQNLYNFLQAIVDKNDYLIAMDDYTLLFFRYAGEHSEYNSADEFATILYENIKEELRIKLKIATGGTIKSFRSLAGCYERVLLSQKFGEKLAPQEDIYCYKNFVLLSLMSDVPRPTLNRVLDSLLERNADSIFSDSELMETADEFMRNSLNISETSRNMYIHRNTLIYRLDKIENETGLNLRDFSDAVTFRFIKMLATLVKGDNK